MWPLIPRCRKTRLPCFTTSQWSTDLPLWEPYKCTAAGKHLPAPQKRQKASKILRKRKRLNDFPKVSLKAKSRDRTWTHTSWFTALCLNHKTLLPLVCFALSRKGLPCPTKSRIEYQTYKSPGKFRCLDRKAMSSNGMTGLDIAPEGGNHFQCYSSTLNQDWFQWYKVSQHRDFLRKKCKRRCLHHAAHSAKEHTDCGRA